MRTERRYIFEFLLRIHADLRDNHRQSDASQHERGTDEAVLFARQRHHAVHRFSLGVYDDHSTEGHPVLALDGPENSTQRKRREMELFFFSPSISY